MKNNNNTTKIEKISFKQRYVEPIKFIWQYLKPYKTLFIFVLFASLIASMIQVGINIGEYYFFKHILASLKHPDSSNPNNWIGGKTPDSNTIAIIYLICLLIGVLIGTGLYIAQTFVMAKISQWAGKNLRKDLYFKLLELKLQYFDSTPSGDIMSRMTNDINNITLALTQNITQFLISVSQMFFFLIAIFIYSPIIGIVAIVFVPIQLVVVFILFKTAQPNFYKKQIAIGDMNSFVEETISGQKIINSFNKQNLIVNEFKVKNDNIKNISYKTDLLSSLSNPWNTLMGNLLVAIVFVISMSFSMNNINFGGIESTLDDFTKLTSQLSVISLLTIMMQYLRQFSNPIYQIFQLLNLLQGALAGSNRVMQIKEQPIEVLSEEENITLSNIKGHVQFKNLTFSYNKKTNVLKNIDLDIKSGQVVGIVGPTGSGKTTIINLLTKFYDVTNKDSDILIDNISIKKITKHSLRDEVSIVLQDTFVFGESIYQNMRYAKPDATNEEIQDAARKAGVHSFILTLEKGYDTILENNADDISQGQRQLLAIARAFLKKSSILILDEATSSVDTKTEKDIQSAMIKLSKGKTTFMIAHRLSTIKHADIIVVLKDGQILEKGNHKQLLKLNGFYAQMYNSKLNTPEDV